MNEKVFLNLWKRMVNLLRKKLKLDLKNLIELTKIILPVGVSLK